MDDIVERGFDTMSEWDKIKIRWAHIPRDEEPIDYNASQEWHDHLSRKASMRFIRKAFFYERD